MKVVTSVWKMLSRYPVHQRVAIAEEILSTAKFDVSLQEKAWREEAGMPGKDE